MGKWGFSKLENRGVKIFRRNFQAKLLGEFRVEWVFVHPDPMSAVTCRRGKKKEHEHQVAMRGFWKTGKELSDRAEISRISSWALGDLNLWISARSDNVKGGLVLVGRNFRPDFPHEGKVGGGWNLAGFLVGARATKCIPPHPSATTGTEDRLTLSWFASLKRHECASLTSKNFTNIRIAYFLKHKHNYLNMHKWAKGRKCMGKDQERLPCQSSCYSYFSHNYLERLHGNLYFFVDLHPITSSQNSKTVVKIFLFTWFFTIFLNNKP